MRPTRNSCVSLVTTYTYPLLVFHWSWLTSTQSLFFIGHGLYPRIACFFIVLGLHPRNAYSPLVRACLPVIILLILSTARCICQQHPLDSSQVKVIYYNITPKCFQFFNCWGFLDIYCLFHHFVFYWIFWVILKYIIVSKEFYSFFLILWYAKPFVGFFFFCSSFSSLSGSYQLMLSHIFLNFSCFRSFPFHNLSHFIKYWYFFSVFLYFFLFP